MIVRTLGACSDWETAGDYAFQLSADNYGINSYAAIGPAELSADAVWPGGSLNPGLSYNFSFRQDAARRYPDAERIHALQAMLPISGHDYLSVLLFLSLRNGEPFPGLPERNVGADVILHYTGDMEAAGFHQQMLERRLLDRHPDAWLRRISDDVLQITHIDQPPQVTGFVLSLDSYLRIPDDAGVGLHESITVPPEIGVAVARPWPELTA